MSAPSLTDRQIYALRLFAKLILFAEAQDIRFIMTAYHRTPDEQNALFRRGQSKCDGYVKRSKHQDRLAFDIVVVDATDRPANDYGDAPEYHVLGAEWERMGGNWGGGQGFLAVGINDVFHFEVS